jgi:hypothetical protein
MAIPEELLRRERCGFFFVISGNPLEITTHGHVL